MNGFIKIFNPSATNNIKFVTGQTSFQTPGGPGQNTLAMANTNGYWANTANPLTGIAFLFSSGNIQTGTIKIYGMT